jgi:hypothetical protein
MKRGIGEANAAAVRIASGEVTPDAFTALLQAGITIKANRVAATTADELIGTLLNRKA